LSGSGEPLEPLVAGKRLWPGGHRRRTASDTRREDARLARLLVVAAVVITAALVIYPLVLGFKSSLEAGGAATGTPTHYVGLRNYGEVLRDPDARSAVLHTLEYLALALVLEMSLGVTIAVVLHRVFRGRGIVLAILILPWALPSVVSGVLWRRIFDPDNGLLNSALMHLHIINHPIVWLASNLWALPAITLVHVWGVLPLISLIFLAGLQNIPDEVYSASAVDGASPVRQFWHITLPLLRPSMAVALTVGTILGIGIFDEVFVLNGTAVNTRSILMQVYNTTFANADFAHGTALAFLLAAVTAMLALLFVVVNRRSTT
jgi:multiple sugar transport system permease protein